MSESVVTVSRLQEPWSLGALEPWSRGAVEPWSRGAVEPWSRGAADPRSRGAADSWRRGAVEGSRGVRKEVLAPKLQASKAPRLLGGSRWRVPAPPAG